MDIAHWGSDLSNFGEQFITVTTASVSPARSLYDQSSGTGSTIRFWTVFLLSRSLVQRLLRFNSVTHGIIKKEVFVRST